MKQPVPFGKYTLLERISVGGMAEVFRAKTFGVEGFERLVAVKRILPNIAEDKEFIRMFVDEAKLAVQLNHANIAQITDLGVVDGSYYIALEHVHGRDLRSVFERARARNDTMPVSHACYVAMKVCEGLDYAHNKRDQSGTEISLVHRDVSPQNVLVSFEGEIKLIDFGIAKAVGTSITTQSGVLKGKLGYMSPEQVRGLPVDRRSDVFSCGIVLYEMLTGERLFVAESDFSTLEKVRNVEIHPPTMYNHKIPEELERIVLRALARDVNQRYQHAIDVHDDLQAFAYTAGEFCSRKDMAAWMKKTFARELDEETAKLEAFRHAAAPGGEPVGAGGARARDGRPATRPPALAAGGTPLGLAGPAARAANPTPGPVLGALEAGRRTKAMGSLPLSGSRPPPPPPGRSQQLAALDDPSASSSAKLLALTPPGALPALPPSPLRPVPGGPPTPTGAMALAGAGGVSGGPLAMAGGTPASFGGSSGAGASSAVGVSSSVFPGVSSASAVGMQAAASVATAADAAGVAALGTPQRAGPAAGPGSGTASGSAAGVAAPGIPQRAATSAPSRRPSSAGDSDEFEEPTQGDEEMSDWDDEEEDLETQIYDNDFPESHPVPKSEMRLRPATPHARSAPSQMAPRPTSSQSEVPTGAAPRPAARPPEPSRVNLPPAPLSRDASRVAPPPSRDASRGGPAPTAPPPKARPEAAAVPSVPIPQLPSRPAALAPELAAEHKLLESDQQFASPSSTFGRGMIGRSAPPRNRSLWLLVLGGAALVVGGVVLALTVSGRRGASNAPVAITNDHTGFDLYVLPAGITRWRLDGELRTDRLPSRIRGIAPGVHAVVIEAPPGFMSQSQNVTVEAGRAQRVTIELPGMEITGIFRSDPEGASVTIIADGERKALGPSPATHKLDPHKAYQVLFEKPGYVSANRPVTLSGLERESILVVLEKADGAVPLLPGAPADAGTPGATVTPKPPGAAVAPKPPGVVKPPATPARPATPAVTPRPPAVPRPPAIPDTAPDEPSPPAEPGEGTLQVSAKPPCEILIDGKPTGLRTPQREIVLSAGSHRIGLVNQEYGIDESFSVEVSAGASAKLVKDFSDRLPAESQ